MRDAGDDGDLSASHDAANHPSAGTYLIRGLESIKILLFCSSSFSCDGIEVHGTLICNCVVALLASSPVCVQTSVTCCPPPRPIKELSKSFAFFLLSLRPFFMAVASQRRSHLPLIEVIEIAREIEREIVSWPPLTRVRFSAQMCAICPYLTHVVQRR